MRSAQPLHPLRIIFCRLNYYYFLPTAALFDQEQREIKKKPNNFISYIYITACLFKQFLKALESFIYISGKAEIF